MKKVRVISLALAILLTIGMITVVLSGCGDDKEKNEIKETVGETSAATASTQAPTQAITEASQGKINNSGNSAETLAPAAGSFGEQEAVQNVLAQEADGTYVQSYYYTKDENTGIDGWMVTVTRADGSAVTYFSGYQYCYIVDEDDNDDGDDDDDDDDGYGINDVYYANTSEQMAGQTALGRMGEGWMIISSNQGTYEGVEAWVVTMTGPDGQTVRAYVNGGDCYFG